MQKIALVLTIIGSLNWGLIGLFDFNLVENLFGRYSFISMLIYLVIGICGLVNIMLLFNEKE